MKIKKKRVIFFLQRAWGVKIGHQIAKRFYEKGYEIGGITLKKEYHNYYKIQDDFKYSYLECHEDILQDPKRYLKDDDYTLDEICKELNIASIWPYVQSSRGHVKSYYNKYGYCFRQNVPDEEIIYYIKAIFKLLKKIEKNFEPDVFFMPNFISLLQIMTYFYFRNKKVKISAITNTFATNNYVFTNDVYESTGKFFDKVKEYELTSIEAKFKIESEKILNDLRSKFLNSKKQEKKNNMYLQDFFSFIKNILFYFKRFHFLKRSNKKLLKLQTADYARTTLKFIIRDYFASTVNKIKSNNLNYYSLDNLNNYVFFALQNQPEDNIDVASVEYNNQIETARKIAMFLPKNLTLVVKEHPQMHGERSYKYLHKVLMTPNIKLVHHSNSSIEILKSCKYLISTTGTIFFEAAVLKKASIVLGNLGFCKILPNVKKLNNFRDIPKLINEFENELSEFKHDYDKKLINIISSSLEKGFDNNYQRIWSTNYTDKNDLDKLFIEFYNEAKDK